MLIFRLICLHIKTVININFSSIKELEPKRSKKILTHGDDNVFYHGEFQTLRMNIIQKSMTLLIIIPYISPINFDPQASSSQRWAAGICIT